MAGVATPIVEPFEDRHPPHHAVVNAVTQIHIETTWFTKKSFVAAATMAGGSSREYTSVSTPHSTATRHRIGVYQQAAHPLGSKPRAGLQKKDWEKTGRALVAMGVAREGKHEQSIS